MRSSARGVLRGLFRRSRRRHRRSLSLGVEGLEQRRVLTLFASGSFGWAGGFEAGPAGNPAAVGGDTWVNATAIDAAGSMYVAGGFSGNVDFDPSNASSPLTAGVDGGMYVAKYSPLGALQWVRGVSGARPASIAVSAVGNVIVAGDYSGRVDFDPGAGERWVTATGSADGFVLSLTGAGSYGWSRSVGSGDPAGGVHFASVLVAGDGAVYVAGDTAVHEPLDAISVVGRGIVRRLDAAGNDVWSRTFGSGAGGQALATSLHQDGAGGIHVGGRYWNSIDLDPGQGVVMAPNAPNSGTFLVRLTADGLYSRSVAQAEAPFVTARAVAVAADGSIYAGGSFRGTIDLETVVGASARGISLTAAGREDGLLMKLNSAGSLVWVRTLGSVGDDGVTQVATNAAGTVFVGGVFGGSLDFDAGPGAAVLTPTGTSDAFLLRLGAGGGYSTVRHYGSAGGVTEFDTLAVGPNGGVLWSGDSQGVALDADPEGAGAVLQRAAVNAVRPRVGTFFAKESFAPGTFVPAGVEIEGVEFGATGTGYALRVGRQVTQVRLGNANASASRPGNGWVALGARPSGTGYELLWRNTRNASSYAWVLSAAGIFRHGFDIGLEEIHDLEVQYDADITGDGLLGQPPFQSSNVTIGSVEFGATSLGYAFRDGARLVHVTGPKGHASESYPGGGWSAFGARRNGAGYEVLWHHETLGYFAWTLDAFGRYVAGRSVELPEIYELESLYGLDITDDGSIGRPFTSANVTIEGVEFGTTGLGYAVRVDGKVLQVTFPGGNASAANPADGGVALGARRSGDGFELLWVNPRSATYYGWMLDATGAFRNRFDIQLPEVHRLETLSNVDITGDGTIGPIRFTSSGVTIGAVEFGSTLLGYAMQVNKQVLQVTFANGYATPRNQNGWVALGARRSNAGYEVLWRNQPATAYYAWTVDAFGRHTGGRDVLLAEIHALETLHGVDITGEGTIGPPGAA